jgi:hypothetical protein
MPLPAACRDPLRALAAEVVKEQREGGAPLPAACRDPLRAVVPDVIEDHAEDYFS